MWSAIATGVRTLLKSKTLSKILKAVIPIIIGFFLLILIIAGYVTGTLINSLKEHGEQEIVRQQNNISGGLIQNPKTDYKDNEVPKEFEKIYKEIAKKYGVEWEVLASIHRVETVFSSNVSKSSVGAIGHTQFMKCTWVGWSYKGCSGGLGDADIPDDVLTDPEKIKRYGGKGVDGNGNGKADPMEISDALSSTAKKLKDDGINTDFDKAILKYNQSNQYLKDIKNFYNNYKNNIKFVVSGIKDPEKLGQTRKGTGSADFVGDIVLPVPKDVFFNKMSFGIGDYPGHPGYDFVLPIGTPVYSIVDGEVMEVQTGRPDYPTGRSLAAVLASDDMGNYVRIKPDNNPNVMVNYLHLTKNDGVSVKKGDKIKKGDEVGLSGNSGKSTGPHLHIDMLENNNYSIDSAIHWYDDFKKKLKKESD